MGDSEEHPYLNSFRQGCVQCWDMGNLEDFYAGQKETRDKQTPAVRAAIENIYAKRHEELDKAARERVAGGKQGGLAV